MQKTQQNIQQLSDLPSLSSSTSRGTYNIDWKTTAGPAMVPDTTSFWYHSWSLLALTEAETQHCGNTQHNKQRMKKTNKPANKLLISQKTGNTWHKNVTYLGADSAALVAIGRMTTPLLFGNRKGCDFQSSWIWTLVHEDWRTTTETTFQFWPVLKEAQNTSIHNNTSKPQTKSTGSETSVHVHKKGAMTS